MLLATSAQSHIFPEIRVDSIKLIDVFLDVFPEVVTSEGTNGHANRVMQGYMGLLVGNAPTSESSTSLYTKEYKV
jgi:pre-rRNA-processing protein IPI1